MRWSFGTATGLLLEVADSLAAPGAGFGLFVRKACDGPDVALAAGQPLCGYPARASPTPSIEGGKTTPDRADAHCRRQHSPEEVTERDLAVLVLDSKVVAAALAANCAGKASFNCPSVFDPSLTGLRLAEATQNMLCVQDAARLPNHGRRVTVPAPDAAAYRF